MTKKSNLYTRTGDQGQTSLVGGQRVSKTCARLESYGTIDELNSFLGLLISHLTDEEDRTYLQHIQSELFVVGSYLATDVATTPLRAQSVMTADRVEALEQKIDEVDEALPPLRLFVLPGGSQTASLCHVCRTICRRAERRILALAEETEIDPLVIAYVNRLSDLFFALARKQNVVSGCDEVIWRKQK